MLSFVFRIDSPRCTDRRLRRIPPISDACAVATLSQRYSCPAELIAARPRMLWL